MRQFRDKRVERQYQRVTSLIEQERFKELQLEEIHVDYLWIAFKDMGYEPGLVIGEHTTWYRNVVSTERGYLAEMEVISPEGRHYGIAVTNLFYNKSLIVEVERRKNHEDIRYSQS